jgi:hypothetical protein
MLNKDPLIAGALLAAGGVAALPSRHGNVHSR